MTAAPFYADDSVTLWQGDALEVMQTLGSGSVDCIVTSPPYYGLRDYGVEGQYGLEESPAAYVETMRALFAEARRVLADDGTLWLNIGDSYSGNRGNVTDPGADNKNRMVGSGTIGKFAGKGLLPAKNLLGIPWQVAFALQDDGWILRNDIIWAKPNAMPESVTDRLSNKHEHLFMFSKGKWSGDSRLHLADVDAAWLAALIDGEGSITIGRDKRSEKNPAHQDVFQISVSIANTCVPLLEKASRLMGGPRVRKNNVGVNRPGYAVQMSGKKAAEVIAAVKPWLIDKLVQSDIALALQDTQRAEGVDKTSYQSAAGRAYKERLHEAMRVANRREPQDLSWMKRPRRGSWSPQPYWFDLDPIREPHAEVSVKRAQPHRADTGRAAREGLSYAGVANPQTLSLAQANHENGRNPGDVWTIPTQPFSDAHFAVMPLALASRAIQAGCKTGGTVLDPFSGSGTTGLAAAKHGRKYVGIDLNRDYLELSLRTRLAQPALLEEGIA